MRARIQCALGALSERRTLRKLCSTKDKFDFEVRWHPFFQNPDAPKEGIKKSDYYKMKFGPAQFERATARMTEIFQGLGLQCDMSGLTGSTMDSHRLITLAGHQGYEKQNALVEEIFLNYFVQGKYIGDSKSFIMLRIWDDLVSRNIHRSIRAEDDFHCLAATLVRINMTTHTRVSFFSAQSLRTLMSWKASVRTYYMIVRVFGAMLIIPRKIGLKLLILSDR